MSQENGNGNGLRISITNAIAILGFIVAGAIAWGRMDSRQSDLIEWQKSANIERADILNKLSTIEQRLIRMEARTNRGTAR